MSAPWWAWGEAILFGIGVVALAAMLVGVLWWGSK